MKFVKYIVASSDEYRFGGPTPLAHPFRKVILDSFPIGNMKHSLDGEKKRPSAMLSLK